MPLQSEKRFSNQNIVGVSNIQVKVLIFNLKFNSTSQREESSVLSHHILVRNDELFFVKINWIIKKKTLESSSKDLGKP